MKAASNEWSSTGKLVAAPRYQLYIYLLLLEKFFVAQDGRALEASIRDVRSQNQPPLGQHGSQRFARECDVFAACEDFELALGG